MYKPLLYKVAIFWGRLRWLFARTKTLVPVYELTQNILNRVMVSVMEFTLGTTTLNYNLTKPFGIHAI